jgi:hypothetical protein
MDRALTVFGTQWHPWGYYKTLFRDKKFD